MIRLTHVITSMSRGGAQSMLVKLTNELADRGGYKQDVVVMFGRNNYEFNPKVAVHYLGMSKNNNFVSSLIEFRSLIKTLGPDVLQSWMYHANFLAYFSGIRKRKIIFNIRHSLDDVNNEKRLTRLMITIGSYLSRFVYSTVYCSEVSMKQHYSVGYSKSRSIYIPNGFDFNKFSPNVKYRTAYRKRLMIDDASFVFGSVARFHPMKNHIGLIKDFSLLEKESNCSLVLIGEGVVNREIKQLIKALKIESKVILLDKKEDIHKWLPAIDSIVIPSLWGEAFPNILGESMSTEIPCIVSQVGDAPLILGDCGIVIKNTIHRSMEHIYKLSIADRRNLGKMARNRVITNYSISNSINKYHDLYLEII